MSAQDEKPDSAAKADPRVLPPTTALPGAPVPGTGDKSVSQLTPEEQMALFEKELKETDWGHQPC